MTAVIYCRCVLQSQVKTNVFLPFLRGQGFTWLSQGNFYPASSLLFNLNSVIFYVLLVGGEPGNVYITLNYFSCFMWCSKLALGPSQL